MLEECKNVSEITQWHGLCYYLHKLQGRGVIGTLPVCEEERNNVEDTMKKMRRLWTWLTGCALTLLVLMPSVALAAKKAAANVVIVADTRRLDGIMLWWAQMYNDSHLYFTILTIIIIPVTGCIFGVLADIVMSHIGIDLKHRELAEH